MPRVAFRTLGLNSIHVQSLLRKHETALVSGNIESTFVIREYRIEFQDYLMGKIPKFIAKYGIVHTFRRRCIQRIKLHFHSSIRPFNSYSSPSSSSAHDLQGKWFNAASGRVSLFHAHPHSFTRTLFQAENIISHRYL